MELVTVMAMGERKFTVLSGEEPVTLMPKKPTKVSKEAFAKLVKMYGDEIINVGEVAPAKAEKKAEAVKAVEASAKAEKAEKSSK